MTQEQRDWGKLISVSIVMLIILIAMLSGCREDFIVPYSCIDEEKIVPYSERVCTMDIDYVCGCNGYLYINKCYAEADGNTNWTEATVETNCKE